MKSNLDLVNECDNFPYYDDDPDAYNKLISSLYKFVVLGSRRTVGYVQPWVVEKMPWGNKWIVDHDKKRLSPYVEGFWPEKVSEQNQVIDETLRVARDRGAFKVLENWRNELYTIHGPDQLIRMERSGSPLFGIVTYGVHLTAYVSTPDGMKIWVPKRAKGKTYGGMLDNTVAGGIATGEQPFECIVREAAEEASFSEELIRSRAKPCGTISYFSFRDERAGGETNLLQPEVQFVYDMEVAEDVVPKPCDDEVEDFRLWTVSEVQEALSKGLFKPNCALLLLDFFIRHGILTSQNEDNYVEIVSRLHRKLPFPTAEVRHQAP
ncbi:MAG: hypothetical protein LQ338_000482 [Usnochroma carphineum]|nr:MAG: hypothetical protein LQ338_000482 [Usnochroma carphineum]